MVAERRTRVLILRCRLALWVVGLRNSLHLLRLGVMNTATALAFQFEASGSWRRVAREAWMVKGLYAGLFRIFPALRLPGERDRKRTAKTYKLVKGICARNRPRFDPLSSSRAIRLQSAVLQYTFRRLLGFGLTVREAALLGRYGSASLAVKEFLEFCGFDRDSPGHLALSYAPLASHLSAFMPVVELRHRTVAVRRSILQNLVEKARLLGQGGWRQRLGSLWVRVEHLAQRTQWDRHDTRERMSRTTFRGEAHAAAYREIIGKVRRLTLNSQRALLTLLAAEMSLRAADVLSEIAAVNRGNFREPSLDNYLDRLQHNLDAVISARPGKESQNGRENWEDRLDDPVL